MTALTSEQRKYIISELNGIYFRPRSAKVKTPPEVTKARRTVASFEKKSRKKIEVLERAAAKLRDDVRFQLNFGTAQRVIVAIKKYKDFCKNNGRR